MANDEIRTLLNNYMPELTNVQRERFAVYYDMLIDWNTRMNLTAITEPRDVLYKHFMDSVLPEKYIRRGASCIDIGTGAGFPGIPLLIVREDISVTLLDSLNKRLVFLNEVLSALGLTDRAKTIHARAEDGARLSELRGRFDAALTRAVASADKLIEWTVPYINMHGASIMYKTGADELKCASRALKELRAEAEAVTLDAAWGERCVIIVKKTAPTPDKYPRSAAEMKKRPLV